MSETEKAVNNFGKGATPFEFIYAMSEVKEAIFRAVQQTENIYSERLFNGITDSISEIKSGKYNHLFVLPLKQGSAGTSLHMNYNEVLSDLIMSKTGLHFHPVEDCARYHSTNDAVSTAVVIVFYRKLVEVEKKVVELQEVIVDCEKKWGNSLITGRTEFQAALPMTLSQLFSSYNGIVERDRWRLQKLKERVRIISLGGTAVGTGFFAPVNYVFAAERNLRNITSLPLSRSQNSTDSIAHHDSLSEAANGLKLIASGLVKMSNDFMYYTSSSVNEALHPQVQTASTIMPAKNNPVLLEFVKGLSISVQYEADKIARYIQEGNLQLNAFLPFILESFLIMTEDCVTALDTLSWKFLKAVSWNIDSAFSNLINSNALLNTLRPVIGYLRVKEISEQFRNMKFENYNHYLSELEKETGISSSDLEKMFDPCRCTVFTK